MPRIPYDPVPDATSQGSAPAVSAPTLPDAFGAGTAQALSHLGSQLEKSGDELFTRALAMQQLENESTARAADVEYMEAAGLIHAKYNSLQGKDAVAAYPQYIQDLKASRDAIKAKLSNDQVRKMYDAQTSSTLGRTIFNGAGHAASENRQYAIGTVKAQIEVDARVASDNPRDDLLFQDKLNRTRENVRQWASLEGVGDGSPQEQARMQAEESKLWRQRITGLSRIAPFEAKTMLDRNGNRMTEADKLAVDSVVTASGRAVGANNIANEVYSAGRGTDDKPGKTLTEMETQAEDRARKLAPDDPILAQQSIQQVRTRWNQDKYATNQEALAARQTVAEAIEGGADSVQRILADPITAAAYDRLPKTERLKVPGMINRYIASRDAKANDQKDIELRGMALDNREEYLNLDMTDQKLSASQVKWHMNLQRKLKEKVDDDPRVWRAISQMRAAYGTQMQALGLDVAARDKTEDWYNFVGSVQSALDVWQQDKKKPPTYKEFVDQIAPELLKTKDEPGAIFGNLWPNKTPKYQEKPKKEWIDTFTKGIEAAGGLTPTPEQIQRAYIRTLYQKDYEAKKQKSQERVK